MTGYTTEQVSLLPLAIVLLPLAYVLLPLDFVLLPLAFVLLPLAVGWASCMSSVPGMHIRMNVS